MGKKKPKSATGYRDSGYGPEFLGPNGTLMRIPLKAREKGQFMGTDGHGSPIYMPNIPLIGTPLRLATDGDQQILTSVKSDPVLNAVRQCIELSGGQIINLTEPQFDVIGILVKYKKCSLGDLKAKTGNEYPNKIVDRLLNSHPELKPYLKMAVKKGFGYSTTIRLKRSK